MVLLPRGLISRRKLANQLEVSVQDTRSVMPLLAMRASLHTLNGLTHRFIIFCSGGMAAGI